MANRQDDNPLGSYLRARREQIDPTERGLPRSGRRVAGLRREEVADLVGLSVPYYVRLEQGRDRHPSASVIDALATVLGVDEPGRAYMRKLVEPERTRGSDNSRGGPRPEMVDLLTQWTGQAALVLGRYRDVLAANALATAINPNFTPGRNLMREVFLDPSARMTYPDWEQVAAEGVAALRASSVNARRDPIREQLISELSAGSAEFARLWALHDARDKPSGHQRFHIPSFGTLDLHYEPLALPYSDGQLLYVFHAIPDSVDARLLSELSTRATCSNTAARSALRHENPTS